MGRKAVHALSQHERLRDEAIKPDIACLFYGDISVETPEQFILRQEEATLLQRAIDRLEPKYSYVLHCRYGIGCEPMQLAEIGEQLGVTPECIRIRQHHAERKLRRLLKTDFIDREMACRKRFDPKPERSPLDEAKVWWEERTRYQQLERARQEAEAARQAVQEAEAYRNFPTQFAKPACDDPVNRYCHFYTWRVTDTATGEWEWVKYDPRTTQV
jgi:hypothetical protein